MRSKSFFIFFCLVLMCSLLTYGPSVTIAQTSEDTATEAQSAVKKPAVPELQDIVPLAANLGKRLEKLNGQFAKLQTTDQVEEDLAPILEGLEKLTERLELLKKAATPDFGQLRGLKSDIQFEEIQIKRIITQITGGIGIIEDAIDEWRLEQQKWAYWREALSQNNLYGYVKPTFVSVEDMFRDAKRIIEKYLKPILAVQQKTWQAQNRILDLKQRVDSMIVAIRGEALGTATPFLFSTHFLEQFNRGSSKNLERASRPFPCHGPNTWRKRVGFCCCCVVVVAMAAVFRRRPDLLKQSERLKWFVNRPVATGCLIGMALFQRLRLIDRLSAAAADCSSLSWPRDACWAAWYGSSG